MINQCNFFSLNQHFSFRDNVHRDKITLKELLDCIKELPNFQGVNVNTILEQSIKLDLKKFLKIMESSLLYACLETDDDSVTEICLKKMFHYWDKDNNNCVSKVGFLLENMITCAFKKDCR